MQVIDLILKIEKCTLIKGSQDSYFDTITDDSRKVNARKWLESQGVVFGKGCYAYWWAFSQRLTVRNTQDQLELIERIVQVVGSGQHSKSSKSALQ